jgi:predicted transport protein
MAGISLDFLLNATGKLQDTEAARRFRASIEDEETVGIDDLERWIDTCLTKSGPPYNFALQDIVNAIGKRLGFEVAYGLYQGRPGKTGYDGLWGSVLGKHIVVDTKTTGAYTIDPGQIMGYIDQIAAKQQEEITAANTFGLFVVGRFDSGPLENSIRGAGLQNKLRVITCSDLLKLLQLKQRNNLTHEQVLRLILPFDNVNVGQLLQVIETIITVQTTGPVAPPEPVPPVKGGVYPIEDKFAGRYAAMKPVYDELERRVKQLGSDVTCYAKKYYIAFKRSNNFGVVQNYINRIDLGLCLAETIDNPRLFDASNWGWSRISKGVQLTRVEDIDDEVMEWLRHAYEHS